MISFSLRCGNGHRFDSWFASGAACDTLLASGHVTCIDCGTSEVSKALMAPAVATDRPDAVSPRADSPKNAPATDGAGVPAPAASPTGAALGGRIGPASLRALAALRQHVEKTADYVGTSFDKEVRAIDDGTAEARPIWGEVTARQARALLEDGLPVAPLPFGPRAKSN